jgi:hypothetical protein
VRIAPGDIDPVLKEKKRAHLQRFFGERPTTQELFPVQLGLIQRGDGDGASAAEPMVSARRPTDPVKQDEYHKAVQRTKLEKIFGVRVNTQDMMDAVESVRSNPSSSSARPTSPLPSKRPDGGASAAPAPKAAQPASPTTGRPIAQTMPHARAEAPQLAPAVADRSQTISHGGKGAAVDPLAAEWAKTKFQQPLVAAAAPQKAAPVAVVKRHRQTLIEADYGEIPVTLTSIGTGTTEMLYGQLLPESDDEFDDDDFLQDPRDAAKDAPRLQSMLRASVAERSRAVEERNELSRELLARQMSQHLPADQVALHRRSGTFHALARLSTTMSPEQLRELATAARTTPRSAAVASSSLATTSATAAPAAAASSSSTTSEVASKVAWQTLTADADYSDTLRPVSDALSTSSGSSGPPTQQLPLTGAMAVVARTPERRMHVVKELVTTERNHINDVRTLIDAFLTPLCHDESLGEIFLYDTSGAIVALLSTAQLIVESALAVFDNMAAACGKVSDPPRAPAPSSAAAPVVVPGERGETVLWAAAEMGGVFLHSSMTELFTLFGVFVNHQAQVHEALTRAVAAKKAVFMFLERQRLDVAKSQGLRVFDYLAKPFQRSTKYGLLLRDLLKETPESHPDFAALAAACELVQSETTHMNESKALSDNLNMLRAIAARLEMPRPHFVLSPRRSFIREGPLWKDGRVERQFFLFNDVLVYAKRKTGTNFKAMAVIAVGDLVVTDVAESKIFLLHRRDKSKTYTLHAKDAKDKMQWVRDLQIAVIRETSFSPPTLFGANSVERLQAVAVNVSGAAPPRAIVRLWFGSDVQAFVIFAETTVAELLLQFCNKQSNIAKAGAKIAPTDYQVMLRRDNGMYCEETRLKDDDRPVLVQHNLLRDGTVFGDDFDNCFVVRHVTEKPQNMVSIRRKPSAALDAAPAPAGAADSPSIRLRKLTLFKRSARSSGRASGRASPATLITRKGSRPAGRGLASTAAAAFEIGSERSESSSARDTLDLTNRPLPAAGPYQSVLISDLPALPALPGDAPPAEAPPTRGVLETRVSDYFVQETVQRAQASVEALETAIEVSQELGEALKNDQVVRGLIERVVQDREQVERYLNVGIENRNFAAAARAVVRRATASLSVYRAASTDQNYASTALLPNGAVDADDAEDFVSSDEDEESYDEAMERAADDDDDYDTEAAASTSSAKPAAPPRSGARVTLEPALDEWEAMVGAGVGVTPVPALRSAADVYRARQLPTPAVPTTAPPPLSSSSSSTAAMYRQRGLPNPK